MENFQLTLDGLLRELRAENKRPSLLLQSCCGPCSSYVLEYLSQYFAVTVYYSNSNIWPPEEYDKRLSEQKRLIREASFPDVTLLDSRYEPEVFYEAVKGLETEPEGGARCPVCFRMRLEDTAREAKLRGFDYFGTTLTVSPHKNAPLINEIGREIGEKIGVSWLPADFKKRSGYLRSIQLSKEYALYRQDYCGCQFSFRGELK